MANIDIAPQLTLHYIDLNPTGDPTILLLHGLGATGDSWQLQFPPLIESGYRVLVPDMRGFGKSSFPGGTNNSQVMAEDVSRFLKKLDVSSINVMGISMGGTIALQFALDHPKMLESLILINTFARLRPKKLSYWLFYFVRYILIMVIGLPTQARYLVNNLFPNSDQEVLREAFFDQIVQADQDCYRSTIKSFIGFNITERLNEINTPTLVVTGAKDSVVPPTTQFELSENIPTARQVVIHDAGHALIVERPAEFNHAIMEFLNA